MAAIDASQIQAAPASPDAAPAAAPAAAPQGAPAIPQTSDPFLKGVYANPVIQQLAAGHLPAVYASPTIFGQHAPQVIPKLAQGLSAIDLQMIEAPKNQVLVVFNPKSISAQDILHADASGTLGKVAAPLQTGGASAPAPNSPPPPQAPAANATPAPANPQQSPAPAMVSQDLFKAPDARGPIAQQRNRNLTPQPPVGQPLPSQGILNGLFKRAS